MIRLLSLFLIWLIIILSISFFTLLERKALGYVQTRKGPSKVGILGIFQPFRDAIKLFSKESVILINSNKLIFILSPVLIFFLSLLLWSLYYRFNNVYYFEFGFIFFLCISRVSVYTTLIAGWSSNSKYAFLGSMRGVAQTISYEISASFLILSILCFYFCFNVIFVLLELTIGLIFISFFVFFLWFICILAETNRTPFDFVEGESELVSGFNVEFSSELFVLIFIAEYLNILFIRILTSIIFLPNFGIFGLEVFLFSFLFSYMFIHIRGSLPRIRYDHLIDFCWKISLPLTLSFLFFFLLAIGLLNYFIFYLDGR